jgi:hypothetical protein
LSLEQGIEMDCRNARSCALLLNLNGFLAWIGDPCREVLKSFERKLTMSQNVAVNEAEKS